MSVPKKEEDTSTVSAGSLPTDRTAEACASEVPVDVQAEWGKLELNLGTDRWTKGRLRKDSFRMSKSARSKPNFSVGPPHFDPVRCNICEDDMKNPASIPCGHSFCRQCILTHLEKQSSTGVYTCPACMDWFSTRPALCQHPLSQQASVYPASSLSTQMVATDTAVVKSMGLKQLKSEADYSNNDCNKQSKESLSLTVSVSEETKSLSAKLLKPLEVRLKTHVCSYCGQSFSSSRRRRRHSHACSQKGKKFNQIEYFRLHPQTHIVVNSGVDNLFLMRHKDSLKRMIELHGRGITKAASHMNRTIHIISCSDTAGDGRHLPYMHTEMQEDNSTSFNDIFKGKIPKKDVRTVITYGVAGIGKTTLVHKFITDWADGKANEDVDFVLMLPFWKLNLIKDLSCSLQELLLNFHPEFNMLADLKQLDDPKVVVILDGLDEGQFVLDFQNKQMLCDITEASSVDTLITNMIKGNLLPFAKVWITSHSPSTTQIPNRFINRMTDIRPFSDSQMYEYVRESIIDVKVACNILQQMKMSKSLHGICHIPALCAIAASVVKNMAEQGKTMMIQTCTELFSHFLLHQINAGAETESSSEHVEDEDSDRKRHNQRREVMLRFSELALRHFMKNSFVFSEKDLKDSDIDFSDVALILEIFTEINPDNEEFFQEKLFCFTHAIIQEFLAALCVFYAHSKKNMAILQLLLKGMSRTELEKVSLDVLLRLVMDKVLHAKYRHQYFLRFLVGMCLESSQILLKALLTSTSSNSGAAESLLEHIKDLGKQADVSLETGLDLLYCQIEMRDSSVVEDMKNFLRSPRVFSLSQRSEITTMVLMTVGILDELNLQTYHPSEHDTVLNMFVSCCRKAILSNCSLSDDSCTVVASALQQPHCPLIKLDMSGNFLRNIGDHLCFGLKSPNCKLEILRLSNSLLNKDSCEVLASALQQPHCLLRELDLSENDLRDSGIKKLCTGLKSLNCQLEIIRLSNCRLHEGSCGDMASALQQPHSCLRELDMSGNYLKDSGVEKLCCGLKRPNCKLETLRLSNCGLFEYSCIFVASALLHPHCSLRELDMSGNYLMDSGVEKLYCGLKSLNCKLEILRLSGCGLSNQSCLVLNTVLESSHCCLRELDMSLNHLEDSGVNLLTERQRDPSCKLEALMLKSACSTPILPGSSGVISETDTISHCLKELTVDPEGKVKDVCYSKDRECNEDVQVFTPATPASDKTTYRFICGSAGVHQCRYTGLIFKTDTAAEVQYQTVPWDYKKLDEEGLVAAGPLFKMKGLQGKVSQLGFPHCEIIYGDSASSLAVIHMKDLRFEKLQSNRTSATHVFLNIMGFCKFGLAKKRCTEGNVQVWIHALVLLFLDQLRLNVFLLPKNVVLNEVFEKRKKMTQPRNEIYIDTPSKCKLIPYGDYSLTCSSEEHIVSPESAYFDVENYTDYYPTFQVVLSNIEPIKLYLNEIKQNENDNKHVWQHYVNLQESTLWSPYTPGKGKAFFHRHKAALEKRLGLLRPILSGLEECRVLNAQEREEVENKDGYNQNRTLLLMLEKKGGPAQEEFYRVLLECDEYLVKDLEKPHDVKTSAEYPGFLRRDMNSCTQEAY